VIVGGAWQVLFTELADVPWLTLATSRLPMTLRSTGTAHLLASAKGLGQADERGDEYQASARATVINQPDPVSNKSRNST
jgi:hypothetical protein